MTASTNELFTLDVAGFYTGISMKNFLSMYQIGRNSCHIWHNYGRIMGIKTEDEIGIQMLINNEEIRVSLLFQTEPYMHYFREVS